ncbi:MAG: hypothetical protein Q9214_006400, partial [Letrouitia sp. 1 TL-2023]
SYDSQLLRIHDTLTGHLRCEHRIAPKSTITCLEWGSRRTNRRQHDNQGSQAKRKRSKTNGLDYSGNAKDVVVAYGTSGSEIQMYSPTDAKLIGVLSNGHTQGVRDFKFKYGVLNPEGWSIGGDGKLVQWDLQKTKSIRTIVIPDPLATVLCPFGHSIICASNKVVLIDPETTSQNQSFAASSGRIHSVLTSTVSSSYPDLFLTAAESDRFINVFNTEKKDSIGSLVAESDILSLTLSSSDDNSIFIKNVASDQASKLQMLAAINRDGALEIFESPFDFSASLPQGQSESLKARLKRRTRKSTAQVRIVGSDGSNSVLPIIAASFQGNDCILAWAGGGVKMLFHRIPWRKEGTEEALLSGEVEVIKPNPTAISDVSTSIGAKDGKGAHVNESRTIVADASDLENAGAEAQEPTVISISSGEDESDDEDADFLVELEPRQPSTRSSLPDPGHRKAEGSVDDGDVEMDDAEADGLDEALEPGESNERSFGELVKAHAPEPVHIQASISTPHQQISASETEEKLQTTSGMSLSTVLTQSLRTNDINLLETCFHTKDLTVVRATIERLNSSLASSLLKKLAERLHSRPGRAGSLMVWIQWTIVAHGGYLASQRDVMKDLESLHRVVGHRASSLPFLLSLKGKLDMLEAQMNLRKSMQTRAVKANALDDDNDEGVIYIE